MKNHLKIVFLSVIFLALGGCNQPNPHPETIDPIYLSIEKEKRELEGQVSAEIKTLAEMEAALKEVRPQTGQIKYAQKRRSESQARLDKLQQMKIYLELRLNTRLKESQRSYREAFEKGAPWPDPKELQVYKSQRALELAPKSWSAKARIEQAAPPKKPGAGGGHGDAPPAEH